MILSASRRTDIPARFPTWMVNRLRAGEVLVPHPRNPARISRIPLSPDWVDCIVFWTKDPAPMLPLLDELDAMGYLYQFQVTLNPYGRAVEPGLPPVAERVESFRRLSRRLGAKRVVWRYDPVLLTRDCSIAWQLGQFHRLCGALAGATERCIFSFVDPYRRNPYRSLTSPEMQAIAAGFAEIAAAFALPLYSCAELVDLSAWGVRPSACIDRTAIEQLIGFPMRVKPEPSRRPGCGCVQSADIGVYDSCPNGCRYCYATPNPALAARRAAAHDPQAPMLTGWPSGREICTDHRVDSCKVRQLSFFDTPLSPD